MDPEQLDDWAADFVTRRDRARRAFHARQPQKIGRIVAQLITSRGYGRTVADRQLADAWNDVVGPSLGGLSRACRIHCGRLEVLAASSTVLQELNFDQSRIVRVLNEQFPEARIRRLQIRVGRLS